MDFILRDYQERGVQLTVDALLNTKRICLAAPMGTGKSVIELAAQEQVPGSWIVTPRVEIIQGMMKKLGYEYSSEAKLLAAAWAYKITTPVRLRNALLKGELHDLPTGLIIDEGHHIEAETYQQILLCVGRIGVVLLTASPFRGTPNSTARFRETWGAPEWLLTYREAIEKGYMSLPVMQTVPLVDDDVIEISNGELQISSIEAATRVRMESIVELLARWFDPKTLRWDKPTIVSMPSTNLVMDLKERLDRAGIPSDYVVQDSSYNERQEAFKTTLACETLLIQINVVSEGVDLPLRRLVDCSPTLSPVKWIQQVGRITRPGGEGEYYCTNRNLLRHAYLFDGTLPAQPILQAQEAFVFPSKRAGSRVVGLEALGRLKPATVELKCGVQVTTYAVSTNEGGKTTEHFVILHPRFQLPIWAKKENVRKQDGTLDYGRWVACQAPSDLQGFASLAPKAVSEKQLAWWKRCAGYFGLDAESVPTRKTFQILPVLGDLNLPLRG